MIEEGGESMKALFPQLLKNFLSLFAVPRFFRGKAREEDTLENRLNLTREKEIELIRQALPPSTVEAIKKS